MLSVPPAYRSHEIQWAITACFFLLDYLKKTLNIGEGILPWMQQNLHTLPRKKIKQKNNNINLNNKNKSSLYITEEENDSN